jgi:hypothetical protein
MDGNIKLELFLDGLAVESVETTEPDETTLESIVDW